MKTFLRLILVLFVPSTLIHAQSSLFPGKPYTPRVYLGIEFLSGNQLDQPAFSPGVELGLRTGPKTSMGFFFHGVINNLAFESMNNQGAPAILKAGIISGGLEVDHAPTRGRVVQWSIPVRIGPSLCMIVQNKHNGQIETQEFVEMNLEFHAELAGKVTLNLSPVTRLSIKAGYRLSLYNDLERLNGQDFSTLFAGLGLRLGSYLE